MINEDYSGIRHDLINWREIYQKIGAKESSIVLNNLYEVNELEERFNKELQRTIKRFKQFQELAKYKVYNFERDFNHMCFRSHSYELPKEESKRKMILIESIITLKETNEFIKEYSKRLKNFK